ncbi:MAG TPA: hypothetical protein ENK18_10610 [Deltaproteobacteria bacterium]|nr:hypothetical protein [Deltaproteobacteria bacterium]
MGRPLLSFAITMLVSLSSVAGAQAPGPQAPGPQAPGPPPGPPGDPGAPPCPDRLDRLDRLDEAERSVVEADLASTARILDELEAALSCGTIAEPELLGRTWLVEGALLTLEGDPEAAADAWRAAARVAPGLWVEDFGGTLREAYEIATDHTPRMSSVRVEPPLFQFMGFVDGRPASFPHPVEAGLHVIQIGPDIDQIQFARVLLVFPDAPSVVITGLDELLSGSASDEPPRPDPAPGAPLDNPRAGEPRLTLHTAAGAALTLSSAESASDDPPTQITVPIETGLVVRPGGVAWLRAVASAAPLLGGSFSYTDARGPGSASSALGWHLAGGLAAEQGDMGLLVEMQWPGRWGIRGVLASAPLQGAPLGIEGRIGLSFLADSPPAPSLELLAVLRPRLLRVPEPPEAPLSL